MIMEFDGGVVSEIISVKQLLWTVCHWEVQRQEIWNRNQLKFWNWNEIISSTPNLIPCHWNNFFHLQLKSRTLCENRSRNRET